MYRQLCALIEAFPVFKHALRHVHPVLAFNIINCVCAYSLFAGISALTHGLRLKAAIAGVWLIATLYLSSVSWKIHFHKYSIIIPKQRNEMPGFWTRNSDKVILALFSAIVGGVIALLVKKVTGP